MKKKIENYKHVLTQSAQKFGHQALKKTQNLRICAFCQIFEDTGNMKMENEKHQETGNVGQLDFKKILKLHFTIETSTLDL